MGPIRDAFHVIRDIRRQGLAIDLWGAALNGPQAIGGLVYIGTLEGRAILGTLIVTLLVAGQIHKRQPFSRLTGLCHLPWLALLPWLVDRLLSTHALSAFTVWLGYVAIVIAISLVFDGLDVWRYARGDRRFAWSRSGPSPTP